MSENYVFHPSLHMRIHFLLVSGPVFRIHKTFSTEKFDQENEKNLKSPSTTQRTTGECKRQETFYGMQSNVRVKCILGSNYHFPVAILHFYSITKHLASLAPP